MSLILVFARKWNASYRVLRYGKAFSLVDSVHYGCGWHAADRKLGYAREDSCCFIARDGGGLAAI
jgi:hypothetical protein